MAQQPLDLEQQELVNAVKLAHTNLNVARKTRVRELERRLAEDKLRLQREAEQSAERIKIALDQEVTDFESDLDEALIVAFNQGVPISRIAVEGFGNRYPGGVMQLITKLREAGRIGAAEGYQRNRRPADEVEREVAFPKRVDMNSILAEATTVTDPVFASGSILVLAEADPDHNQPEVSVPTVVLTMDARDPYFKSISKSARPGTKFAHATTATLYLHPATNKLVAYESPELASDFWDHPVARWAKDHPTEALIGYNSALSAAAADAN